MRTLRQTSRTYCHHNFTAKPYLAPPPRYPHLDPPTKRRAIETDRSRTRSTGNSTPVIPCHLRNISPSFHSISRPQEIGARARDGLLSSLDMGMGSGRHPARLAAWRAAPGVLARRGARGEDPVSSAVAMVAELVAQGPSEVSIGGAPTSCKRCAPAGLDIEPAPLQAHWCASCASGRRWKQVHLPSPRHRPPRHVVGLGVPL